MIRILSSIEDEKYEMLIDYLAAQCDVFTFFIRNYYQNYMTEKNLEDFKLTFKTGFKNEEDKPEYIQYKEQLKDVLRPFKPFYIREYSDVEYLDWVCSHKLEIKVIKFDKSLVQELKKAQSLYNWKAPNRPEDISFFINGKCFLQSVGHENYCFIYAEDEETMSILDKIGFEYWLEPDGQVPTIHI